MSTIDEILNAIKHLSAAEQAEVRRRLEILDLRANETPELESEVWTANNLREHLHRKLYWVGLVKTGSSRSRRSRPRRPAIKIKGKPMSETIIEDRR